MGEISLEGSTVNKFISSLSKSIQALCHGCMDFNTSITMVGYININIDSDNVVDCVLNEKVRKSTANSITCISNSFHAKKDKPKQTRDASCSPVRQIDHPPKRPHGFTSRGSMRKKRFIPHSTGTSSSYDYYSPDTAYQHSTNTYSEQTDSGSNRLTNPDQTVKAEFQDNANLDPSASSSTLGVSVKKETETTDSQSGIQETSEEPGSGKDTVDNKNKDYSNESFSDSYRAENSNEMADGSSNFQQELRTEDSNEQGSSYFGAENDQYAAGYSGAQEEDYDDSQFEVIEIGDDDEDMQGFFDQPGTENVIGHHVQTTGMVYPWNTGYTTSEYLASSRERKIISARLYRLNRTNEQIERERRLGRLRQRRRRAKLKAQQEESGGTVSNDQSTSAGCSFVNQPTSSSTIHGAQLVAPTVSEACPLCSIHIFNKYHFQLHMQNYHPQDFPFKCDLCGKGFMSSNGLKLHVASHAGRSFSCDVCDKKFFQKIHLCGHLRNVHKCIMCRTCSKIFKMEDFQRHVLSCSL